MKLFEIVDKKTGDIDFADLPEHYGEPSAVTGSINVRNCGLGSLKGLPREINGFFDASNNHIRALENFSTTVGMGIDLSYNLITSLKNIHLCFPKMNGTLNLQNNTITSHILGLFMIEGLTQVKYLTANFSMIDAFDLVNRALQHHPSYAEGRKAAMYWCQEELLKKELDSYAQV